MSQLSCCDCGIVFGVPDNWEKNRRNDKREFFCPNGHPQLFRESEADVLRRERDRLKQQMARVEWERDAANRKTVQAEKKLKQAHRRAVAGVCPCCKRTFNNVQRHMQSKHPNVVQLQQEAKQ